MKSIVNIPQAMLTQVESIKAYIDATIKTNYKINNSFIAKETRLPVNVIDRHFKKVYGLTIHSYTNKLKIEMSKSLLLNPAHYKIEYVANKCGLPARSYSRLFYKFEKTSPNKYRVQHLAS